MESRALVVSLAGPPGIGKTRLQREAVARLLARAQIPEFVFQRSEAYRSNAMMVLTQLQRIRARREEGEGGSLMRRAGQCFESKDFRQAETLLAKALELFVREYGEQHPNTQAAAQNLSIARQNGILQLWREVVAEEALSLRQEADKGKSQRELDAELRLIGAQTETSRSSCSIS